MNIAQIEENVKALMVGVVAGQVDQAAFIYELLLAYGHRKQSVTRLRSGERNMASKSNEPCHDEIIWKRHLYYRKVEGNALHAEIDQMRREKLVATNKIRFVIVTNFDQLLAVDTKTSDILDINLDELSKQFDFFLPWAGMEKAVYQGENPADVKAAEKMAKLFDLIKGDNFDETNKGDTKALHKLNVFLTRLLFCFFAEDTEIFTDNQFSHAIQSHTKADGSDLSAYLNRLFTVLNTADGDRGALPDAPHPQYLANFPYVNGGLFADDIPSPAFTAKSRRMLIECGSELNWSDINPDIFGSMIQAVVHPDQRGGMGMHYTSVTNIMKVIEPLILNDLYEELEKVESSAIKLQKLQQRLGEIKIFDPACGSGNFLIIAYKELRKLEMEVLKRLQELEIGKTGQISQAFSVIKLSQFYGIELDDFAHEVAILSLWLAEHQMNVEFKVEFGESVAALPLQKSGNIICGNAARVEWNTVCQNDGSEIYICSNPPYYGARNQSQAQKEDVKRAFDGDKNHKDADYISCWFIYASKYIQGSITRFAFVSTNSVCQGDHVAILWPTIFSFGLEIYFAHESFKWTNNARQAAGVTCVIIGIRNKADEQKYIYRQSFVIAVGNINGYLANARDVVVGKRNEPISPRTKMVMGSQARDGGYLILTIEERNTIIALYPEARRLFKVLIGSDEFIKGKERSCLWISDEDRKFAESIPEIASRIHSVHDFRVASKAKTTNGYAAIPHKFAQRAHKETGAIIIPAVSSERRKYIPMGFVDNQTIISNRAFVIYSQDPLLFGVISSYLHMVWVNAVAGRLETRINYSSGICYNNFPMPSFSKNETEKIISCVFKVLEVREQNSDKTIAALYDPENMPEGLISAHDELDRAVEQCYRKNEFESDDERLEFLFNMYEKTLNKQAMEGQNA